LLFFKDFSSSCSDISPSKLSFIFSGSFCPFLAMLVKETAEIETGMVEKSSWD
jgi:hypothetical protein